MRTCLLTDTPTLASHTHINTNPQVAGIDFAAELIRMSLQSQHVSCFTRSFAVLVRSPRLPHDALLTNPSRFF